MGEKWPRILPKVTTSTSLLGSFTCRKARHATDSFTSPPKEGVLWKNPTVSAGFEPANLGTKGQHATSRPPKPLFGYLKRNISQTFVLLFRCIKRSFIYKGTDFVTESTTTSSLN
jgi:hypothetical protein